MRSLNSIDATTSRSRRTASSTTSSNSSVGSASTRASSLRATAANPKRGPPPLPPPSTTTTATATDRKPPSASSSLLVAEREVTITEPRRRIRATISSSSLRKKVVSRNSTLSTTPRLNDSSNAGIKDTTPSPTPAPPPPPTTTTTTTSATTRYLSATKRLSTTLPRVALIERNHNAVMTRPAKATTPLEKGSSNPRGPVLSAAAAKAMMGRGAPLTPKIATTTTTSSPAPRIAQPQQQQQLQSGATTPLARRAPPAAAAGREEFASPVAPFLSSNVTPRSGSRQNRVDSANSTPCGTPNPDRDGWATRSGVGAGGGSNFEPEPLRKAATFSPSSEVGGSRDGPQGESKFFFASDVRNVQPQKPAAPPQRSGGTFFYANGDKIESKQNVNSPSSNPSSYFSPTPNQAPDNRSSKFIYANGVPDLHPSPNQRPKSRAGSVVSTTSRMTARPGSAAASNHNSTRPASPIKMGSQQSLKASPQITVGNGKPGASTPGLEPGTSRRKISIDTASRGGHSRGGSVTIPIPSESPALPKSVASIPSSEASSPSNASNSAMTMASVIETADEAVSPSATKPEAVYSELHSPTKANHSSDQLQELVANARRERKVQDLEITNASLAAINRTLERQLRKQTAEIRRYRRLSRSGRLSLASNASSLVGQDSILTGTAIESMSLSDLDEDDEDLGQEDSLEESELSESESGTGSESLSTHSRTSRDIKRSRRDERRLELDLSKHREVLVDSQKINQSIRRCLNWTEELIQEGRKALEYKVHVSDIELGGRVLAPPDEDDEQSSNADESASSHADGEETIHGTDLGDSAQSWSKEAQDRDSGIELPVDGG